MSGQLFRCYKTHSGDQPERRSHRRSQLPTPTQDRPAPECCFQTNRGAVLRCLFQKLPGMASRLQAIQPQVINSVATQSLLGKSLSRKATLSGDEPQNINRGSVLRCLDVRAIPGVRTRKLWTVTLPVTERIVISLVVLLLHFAFADRANRLRRSDQCPQTDQLTFQAFNGNSIVDQSSTDYSRPKITHV